MNPCHLQRRNQYLFSPVLPLLQPQGALTLSGAAAVGNNPWGGGRGGKWCLTWGWEPAGPVPHSPKVWKPQVMQCAVWALWESSRAFTPDTGEPELRNSQVWWFEICRKKMKKSIIIRGSRISPSIFFHMRTLVLISFETQALLQLWPWASEVWHSGLAGEEATTIPTLQLKGCTGCVLLSSAVLGDDQDRICEITRQPYGQPRNYVNIFSEISIGQWLCF